MKNTRKGTRRWVTIRLRSEVFGQHSVHDVHLPIPGHNRGPDYCPHPLKQRIGRMYYILKEPGIIKCFAGTTRAKRSKREREFKKNGPKRMVGHWMMPTVPGLTLCWFWIIFKIDDCAWLLVLADPFKDAAATWLVPAAPPWCWHLDCLWVGTLVVEVLDHGLV